ncbi:MAG: GlgB N-terminal domain-containing protein, partial [Candidatus Acidiferrum sp.]
MPEDLKSSSARLVRALDSHREAQIDALVAGRSADPFAVLGPHASSSPTGYGLTISFFRPHAADAWVVLQDGSEPISARRVRPEGYFEVSLPNSQRS